MGRRVPGIYPGGEGTWTVDKWYASTRLFRRGFADFEEAEKWLIRRLEQLRAAEVHGKRPERLFSEAAAHYLVKFEDKPSIVTETYHLQSVMPTIGHLPITHVHDGALVPHVEKRLGEGRAHKTVNLELGIVRRVLNLCATSWRDEGGLTWLDQAPKVTLLPLAGHQREPRPISWPEQRKLLPKLPAHLSRMALFTLNTGARDDVVCSLRWEWEIRVPELGISVFEVPASNVKGRKRSRLLVCNSVAQSVIESARGGHDDFVFVYQRLKKDGSAGKGRPHPIGTMNNTAWQRTRKEVGLGDLHVHDLRHTTGMRMREAGLGESTRADILWHTSPTMTHHYSMAQIVELHAALEKIKDDTGRWNKSLATLKLEQQAAKRVTSPAKVPQQKQTA
jgi:integrase